MYYLHEGIDVYCQYHRGSDDMGNTRQYPRVKDLHPEPLGFCYKIKEPLAVDTCSAPYAKFQTVIDLLSLVYTA